ncbi:hypothetical protein GWK48_04770 [Metallosphaera tengchongensis]|uniref:Uncharacterized protein n=1 Tax=Metallosphaera tengchongensis TaxID=1532350 RepID=A0A6N0NSH8_9CREN|nr:hypothetical protein [Metallosphaera tengchongensis]QKQ99793.1 hypothetical protein GWK48_04770 [Metallosphaera tengchongensis]
MQVRMLEKEFDGILSSLKSLVYEYNSKIKQYNVYLKPFHVVYKNGKKYIYIGKYWYKLEKFNGKLKWIYLGKTKPMEQLPDPPQLPEITIVKDETSYTFDDSLLNQLDRYRGF